MWRVLGFLLLAITIEAVPASAAEWDSRHGNCYDWEGRWDVREEQPGLWVGYADFVHVDSRCGRGTNAAVRYDVRVAIVGEDLFVYRTAGPSLCFAHGRFRQEGVNGSSCAPAPPALIPSPCASPSAQANKCAKAWTTRASFQNAKYVPATNRAAHTRNRTDRKLGFRRSGWGRSYQ
jgi:hypothetical protein